MLTESYTPFNSGACTHLALKLLEFACGAFQASGLPCTKSRAEKATFCTCSDIRDQAHPFLFVRQMLWVTETHWFFCSLPEHSYQLNSVIIQILWLWKLGKIIDSSSCPFLDPSIPFLVSCHWLALPSVFINKGVLSIFLVFIVFPGDLFSYIMNAVDNDCKESIKTF